MKIIQSKCDICQSEFSGESIELILNDRRYPENPIINDICEVCYNKLRSFIRNGMPKLFAISQDNPIKLDAKGITIHKHETASGKIEMSNRGPGIL